MRDQFPTPYEFARAVILAWLRVGYEVLGLIAYAMKQNEPTDVSANERSNNNEN